MSIFDLKVGEHFAFSDLPYVIAEVVWNDSISVHYRYVVNSKRIHRTDTADTVIPYRLAYN